MNICIMASILKSSDYSIKYFFRPKVNYFTMAKWIIMQKNWMWVFGFKQNTPEVLDLTW